MDIAENHPDTQPRYFDRELTWLQFNHRVQMEADNPDNPLLERAKFLAIVTSNLDEFLQVRYHTLLELAAGEFAQVMQPCGHTPVELQRLVNKEILNQQNLQYLLFDGINSELYHQGIRLYPSFPLTAAMQERMKEIFLGEIINRLKPLPWGEELSPLPQKKLLFFIRLQPKSGKPARYMTIALPGSPRVYELPAEQNVRYLIRQEDIIKAFLPLLFPQDIVSEASLFRILRNQDFDMDASGDVATLVREMLIMRRTGDVMRLETEERMSVELLTMLMKRYQLPSERHYRVTGPLDLNKLMMSVYGMLDRPDLKYPKARPLTIAALTGPDIFAQIAARDWMLYHPYHTFDPVLNLLNRAAEDPDVCSIKMTLYRVGSTSPVVKALGKAAENGKQVTVLFEARARFDEENNLTHGERLRRSGCRVIYGLPILKTHSKALLICRMEGGHMRRYMHLGTGNYHDGTVRLYTDLGLLTADKQLGEDTARFFYGLEGNGPIFSTPELVEAPDFLKEKLLKLIHREKMHALYGEPAGITAKMNSLLDDDVIEALYAASCAGVPISLIVRGICTLVPGVPGRSENIRVCSIVGRNLEHARAFRFENGGLPEIYLSSADWMPRNLCKRVELMFPVKDPSCFRTVENILALQLMDNQKSWVLHEDGTYSRRAKNTSAPLNAQEAMLQDIEAVSAGKLFEDYIASQSISSSAKGGLS